MGFLNLGMSLGLSVGPILAGKISDLAGVPYAFYFATLVGLAGTIGFASLARKGSYHNMRQESESRDQP